MAFTEKVLQIARDLDGVWLLLFRNRKALISHWVVTKFHCNANYVQPLNK